MTNIILIMSLIQKIKHLANKEKQRQKHSISLIASENIAYPEVLKLSSSYLTNKYAEGYPGKRYYSGCKYIDQIERLAIEECTSAFNCKYANVQALTGSIANMAIYAAFLQLNDTILSLNLSHGGHLTHGSKASLSSKLYNFIHYQLDPTTQTLDYAHIRELALKHQPKMIIAGFSSYSQHIDFKEFSKISKDCGAYLFADISHLSGLIISKLHPNCFPWCDVAMTTTHKQLRGPRAAIILWNKDEYTLPINRSIFPGIQGGPKLDQIAGIACTLHKAKAPEFTEYFGQVLANAKALSSALAKKQVEIVSNTTTNHLFLVNTKNSYSLTGDLAQLYLEKANIFVNKNMLPDDTSPSQPSGIRLGTLSITTQGFKESDCLTLAEAIHNVLISKGNQKEISKAKKALRELFKNLNRS